jgi:Tol biopolymer transport system component
MKRRLILVFIAIVWLAIGCGDQPSLPQTGTSITVQITDVPEPIKVSPPHTPTENRPAWLPVPPENQNVIKLTDNRGWQDKMPVWSPDGDQIVFLSNRECVKLYNGTYDEWAKKSRCWEWDLYLMNADGSSEIRLTDVQFRDLQSKAWLRWSPDGEWIVFTYSNDLYLPFERVLSFSLDKAKQAPLGLEDMEVLVDKGEDYQVGSFEWSPDGKKYAYGYYQIWAETDDSWYIVVVDVDSGLEVFRKPTSGESKCEFRAWSPTGEAILVQCVQEADWEYQLDLINLNTGSQRLLIENAIEPAWSPNGRWILYTSTETGLAELFHVESEEVIPIEVPDDVYFLYIWSWSPDGKWVTYDKIESNGFYSWSNIYILDMSWLEMEWDE